MCGDRRMHLYDFSRCELAPVIPGCVVFFVWKAPASFLYHAAIATDKDLITGRGAGPTARLGDPILLIDMDRTGIRVCTKRVTRDTLIGFRTGMATTDFARVHSRAKYYFRAIRLRTPWDRARTEFRLDPYKSARWDPNNEGELLGFTGNCAGFVELCYERVRRDIVDDDPKTNLPPLTVGHLEQEKGGAVDDEDLAQWGLSGTGPWHVLLPGHQIAAIRKAGPFPYTADASDRYYHRS